LSDVEGIESRVRQLLTYASVSDYLFLWGTIWFFGFTANFFFRPFSGPLWLGLQIAGLLGTVLIVRSLVVQTQNWFVVARAALSVLAIVGFGTFWSSLLDMGWREQVTFWPTFLSFLLFLFGLWVGRAMSFYALLLFALSLAGYYFAGEYLHLWMAIVVGGGMIAGGVWLRR
jgi:hypothetical protein